MKLKSKLSFQWTAFGSPVISNVEAVEAESKMATSSKCQSCGMPLKADPKGGGSNADGSLSREYCSFCYVNGAFVNPDMSMEEMKVLVVEKLRERGCPRFVASFFASGLGRLKRWKQAHEPGQG